ncbi:MAG: hypothetical protein JRF40_00555 [Deltaproteobacteria bacterium]|nr:hypothetical protein [Deltaproteobacteria bacterium]
MLDIAVSYNRYKFIGHEFLTWLWFVMEKKREILKDPDIGEAVSLEIGNRLIIENMINDNIEKITIKGDDAGLEEGMMALKKGGVVTELNLIYKTADFDCQFTIKGESFALSALKISETGKIQKPEDVEGVVLEKIFFYEKITCFIEVLYYRFLKIRISEKWLNETVREIKKWIKL